MDLWGRLSNPSAILERLSDQGWSRPAIYPRAVAEAETIVEVHPDPETALSDGYQSLNFQQFDQTMQLCRKVADAVGKTIAADDTEPARADSEGPSRNDPPGPSRERKSWEVDGLRPCSRRPSPSLRRYSYRCSSPFQACHRPLLTRRDPGGGQASGPGL